MILVDTSVWARHYRQGGDPDLAALLWDHEVMGHPWVSGELAMGNLSRRAETLVVLSELPQAPVASHGEVLKLVDTCRLFGRGIGYVDAHLLAAARLAGSTRLWTWDRSLAIAAAELELAYEPPPRG